ncbi:MAG: ATP-binding protein [Negativicutes bacterium]|jgi:two-component system sporulation sensor kinase C
MEFFYTITIGATIGTFAMIMAYLYLYVMFRELSMGLWVASWSALFLRIILFDSGMFAWINSLWGFSIFSILLLSSCILFLWAAYRFAAKPVNHRWIIGGICAFLLSITLNYLDFPLAYKLTPLAWFCSFVLIWAGVSFIKYFKGEFLSNRILGSLYIIWGLHTFDMPFLIDIPQFAPWGYMIEGLLRFGVALASMMFYLEQTRINLAQKESQYRLLAENAVDVIYLYKVQPQAKVEYISPAVTAITGYRPQDFYNDASLLSAIIHPNDIPQFDNFMQNSRPSSTLPLMLRIIRRDQTVRWVEQNAVHHFDQLGNLVSIEGIIRDVTARKNLEQSVSRLDRMNIIGKMAANVAHEIRNPLTTVRGYLQMMANKKDFDSYKDRFELMIDELDRTNLIIREYLSLAKDKLVELQKKDLNTIINSLLPLLEADAIASSSRIKREFGDIPLLYLDENEIRQLLLNLVRNGLEAMPQGGDLHISTYHIDNEVVLAIRDQGGGIPAHILDNLGTPFQTTKENGTGLGLPVCYRIASRHNATIAVDTNKSGTTFFVRFNI